MINNEYSHLAVYVDPDALREEVLGGYIDQPDLVDVNVREWALTLTETQLAEIGEELIQDDRLWQAFKVVVIDGFIDAYRQSHPAQ
jgi:hypothetical protein